MGTAIFLIVECRDGEIRGGGWIDLPGVHSDVSRDLQSAIAADISTRCGQIRAADSLERKVADVDQSGGGRKCPAAIRWSPGDRLAVSIRWLIAHDSRLDGVLEGHPGGNVGCVQMDRAVRMNRRSRACGDPSGGIDADRARKLEGSRQIEIGESAPGEIVRRKPASSGNTAGVSLHFPGDAALEAS